MLNEFAASSLEKAKARLHDRAFEPGAPEHLAWQALTKHCALIVLSDGTRWGRVSATGLARDQRSWPWSREATRWLMEAAGSHDVADELGREHEVFVNIDMPDPGRCFCFTCGWVSLVPPPEFAEEDVLIP
ncbi:MAG: hypothetical protein ACE148_07135 [Vicinamibacterales bacterium]